MTAKDTAMKTEQELFEAAMIRVFGKRINLNRHIEPVDDYTTTEMYKSENIEWAAIGWKIGRAPLLSRIAELEAKLGEVEKDTKRLDYMLAKDAFAVSSKTDSGGIAWQLWNQDEDEEYFVLSGETSFFKTPRDAIDAAMGDE